MRMCRPIVYMLLMGTASVSCGEYHKRVPSGFTGVRGKKSISDADANEEAKNASTSDEKSMDVQKRSSAAGENSRATDLFDGWVQDNDDGNSRPMMGPPTGASGLMQKRAPSGFFGMRGKKYFEDSYPDKRAPSHGAFFGMRGKKEDENYNYLGLEYPLPIYGQPPSTFLPYPIYPGGHIMQQLPPFNDYDYPVQTDPADKRAPKSAFFGMRGKKLRPDSDNDNNDDQFPYYAQHFDAKRAPKSAAFFGMRGRRNVLTQADHQSDVDDDGGHVVGDAMLLAPSVKRARSGFFGMRGKREDEGEDEWDQSLRMFHGLRGKKHRARSLFSSRSSMKMPSDFRGKFVGVRGKKASMSSLALDSGATEFERVPDAHLKDLMFLVDRQPYPRVNRDVNVNDDEDNNNSSSDDLSTVK